jgi:hypothetical protein
VSADERETESQLTTGEGPLEDEILAARRLAAAELRVGRALEQLCQAEIESPAEAYTGGERFDELIREFRAARQHAEAQRALWLRGRAGHPPSPDEHAAAEPVLTPTPRLLFARWLYRHGRIFG